MLGKLAKTLRVLGFDTKYLKYWRREDILPDSLREGRILLTRAHNLPKVPNVFVIESEDLVHQLKELNQKFKISSNMELFTRCLICNTPLKSIRKSEVRGKVPFYVYQTHREFGYCSKCNKFYWKGTHYQAMVKRIKTILSTT